MSLSGDTELKCPKCGQAFNMNVWYSVNTVMNPELREQVLDHSITDSACPGCGQRIRFETDLAYHDMERKFMVSFAKSDNSKADAAILTSRGPDEIMLRHRLRLVASYGQLLDKIRLFEADMNDIVVEGLKSVFWKGSFPDKQITDDSLYFLGLGENATGVPVLIFDVIEEGQSLGQLLVPLAAYTKFMFQMDEEMKSMGPGTWKVVNQSGHLLG